MPVLNIDLSNWGYPTSREHSDYAKRYKCRVHGEVLNMFKIEVRNEDYDLVFDRRYCSICLDNFLQRHLEPLIAVEKKEVNPYE